MLLKTRGLAKNFNCMPKRPHGNPMMAITEKLGIFHQEFKEFI